MASVFVWVACNAVDLCKVSGKLVTLCRISCNDVDLCKISCNFVNLCKVSGKFVTLCRSANQAIYLYMNTLNAAGLRSLQRLCTFTYTGIRQSV
jgi:hypothetical protein